MTEVDQTLQATIKRLQDDAWIGDITSSTEAKAVTHDRRR